MPVVINERTLKEAVWGRDAYALLFILLLIDYTMLTLVNSPQWGGLLRTVPVSVTVLFAIHTSNSPRRVLRVAQAGVVVALTGGIFQAATGTRSNDIALGLGYLFIGLLLMMSPIAILRRVLRKTSVDVETLFAVVDVYIIIGLVFSMAFLAIAVIAGPEHPFLAQPGYHPPSDYVYLSFVTLTTVGFGDLTPYTDLARSVVVLEALIGQIFLVTLVARLVALYSAETGLGVRFVRGRRGGDGSPGAQDGETDDADAPDGVVEEG
jgi:Ion channel